MNFWLRRLLLFQHIGGGSIGLVVFLPGLTSYETANPFDLFILTGFILVSLYGLYGGFKIAEKPAQGLSHAIVFHLLQLLSVSSPLLLYHFGFGLYCFAGVGTEGFGFSFGVGSTLNFFLLNGNSFGLSINLAALIIIFLVILQKLRLKPTTADAGTPANEFI